MKLIITGTPGTGKTSIAKALSKSLKVKVLNEKDFINAQKLGKLDEKTGEIEVDVKELEKKLNLWLGKQKNAIVEGHLLCETRLKADLVIVLRAEPKFLEKRLAKRNYKQEKILDNLFAEQNGYCLKKAQKNYGRKKTVEVFSSKSIKETSSIILKELGLFEKRKLLKH